jgi:hypothetical protein
MDDGEMTAQSQQGGHIKIGVSEGSYGASRGIEHRQIQQKKLTGWLARGGLAG